METVHGHYNIYDYNTVIQNEIIPSDYYEFWGFEDCKLYDIAKNELSRHFQYYNSVFI